MRLYEFASAEEQLALWKLVSDSVWQAIATQAKQEAAEREAARIAAKNKPRRAKGISIGPISPPPPPPAPAKPSNKPEQAKPSSQQQPTAAKPVQPVSVNREIDPNDVSVTPPASSKQVPRSNGRQA